MRPSRATARVVPIRPRRRAAGRLVLFVVAGAVAGVLAQSDTRIPAHPRDLTYAALNYTAPESSECRHLLANGVVAYLVEDHVLPLVSVRVLIRGGAYLDPVGKPGVAGAVGALLRTGGTTRQSPDAFDEEAEFLATNLSSSIGDTSGSASANFLAKDTDAALAQFFEMLRSPAFAQDRLDLYRAQRVQRLQRRNDSTDDIEDREWSRLMRGDDHFTNTFETQASLESLTREDLLAYHARVIHPGNFILAVSGDFETREMLARLNAAMTGWTIPPEPLSAVPEPTWTPRPGVYVVHKPDVNQGRVSIGHLGIRFGNPDEIVVDLMNDVLGGSGFTSRITNRVRSDEGLAYDAGSSFTAGVHYPGEFRVTFQSKSSSVAQAMAIVLEEIGRIGAEDVGRDELTTVQNYSIEIFPRFFSSAGAVAGTFASDALIGRDPQFWMTYRGRVRAVTPADVRRAAGAYIDPARLVILIVGNVDEILAGNPDRPDFSVERLAGGRPIVRIPLPDPMTMVYPDIQ